MHALEVDQTGPERIVLTGFMGSGKTTVGRLLAARLGWGFADLDREVEARAGKPVPRIFAEDGEARFREWEGAVLGITALPTTRSLPASAPPSRLPKPLRPCCSRKGSIQLALGCLDV